MRTIFLLLLCLIPASIISSAEVDKKLHTDCLYPTIIVKAVNTSGTGFIVKSEAHGQKYRNVFITCAHNIPYSFPIFKVYSTSYRDWSEVDFVVEHTCYYCLMDRKNDIAIGVFETSKPMPTVKLDFENKVYIGTNTLQFGHGLSEQIRLEQGKITSVNFNVHGVLRNCYRISAPTYGGDSGGPVFVDYKVVGIMKAIRANDVREYNNIAYCLPIGNLKNIDKSLNTSIDFALDEKVKIPSIPFYFIEFNDLEQLPQGQE